MSQRTQAQKGTDIINEQADGSSRYADNNLAEFLRVEEGLLPEACPNVFSIARHPS
jgi:hypothetical protein